MSNTTFLQSQDDIQWLRETHLPQKSADGFSYAYLYGNEDCPDKILICGFSIYSWAKLYKRLSNNRYRLVAEGRANELY